MRKPKPIFNYFINKFSSNYLIPKAYYYLSYCYGENNKIDDALKIMISFSKRFNKSYNMPQVYFRIASLYEMKNDTKNALDYYKKITEKYKNSTESKYAKIKTVILENNIKF